VKKVVLVSLLLLLSVYLLLAAEGVDSEGLLKKQSSGAIVLDVRTADEVRTGRIKGSVNLDFFSSGFQSRVDRLDKDKTYIAVCRSGRRSGLASIMMKKLGFREVYNYEGGMNRWSSEGRPMDSGVLGLDDSSAQLIRAISTLESRLASRLKEAISKDGFVSGLEVCSVDAMPISSEVRNEFDLIDLKRVGTRVRNPKNSPDGWEADVLEELIGSGDVVKDAKIVLDPLNEKLHAVKPIMVKPLCTQCHGTVETISKKVALKLKELYPSDKAIGYKVGELRGFFHVSQKLK